VREPRFRGESHVPQASARVREACRHQAIQQFAQCAEDEHENLSDDLTLLAQMARRILNEISD
jgi:hypothetical protein